METKHAAGQNVSRLGRSVIRMVWGWIRDMGATQGPLKTLSQGYAEPWNTGQRRESERPGWSHCFLPQGWWEHHSTLPSLLPPCWSCLCKCSSYLSCSPWGSGHFSPPSSVGPCAGHLVPASLCLCSQLAAQMSPTLRSLPRLNHSVFHSSTYLVSTCLCQPPTGIWAK